MAEQEQQQVQQTAPGYSPELLDNQHNDSHVPVVVDIPNNTTKPETDTSKLLAKYSDAQRMAENQMNEDEQYLQDMKNIDDGIEKAPFIGGVMSFSKHTLAVKYANFVKYMTVLIDQHGKRGTAITITACGIVLLQLWSVIFGLVMHSIVTFVVCDLIISLSLMTFIVVFSTSTFRKYIYDHIYQKAPVTNEAVTEHTASYKRTGPDVPHGSECSVTWERIQKAIHMCSLVVTAPVPRNAIVVTLIVRYIIRVLLFLSDGWMKAISIIELFIITIIYPMILRCVIHSHEQVKIEKEQRRSV